MSCKTALPCAISLAMLLCMGCAEPRVVYQKVNVPVKCDIDKPKKPMYNDPKTLGDFNVLLSMVLSYSERLEAALDFCLGGKE